MAWRKMELYTENGYLGQDFYRNHIYNVGIKRIGPDHERHDGTQTNLDFVYEIGITRHDKEPIHDWRHFQKIKNDILGEEFEAVELYPKESRLLDTANTYWMYALPEGFGFPFGEQQRIVWGRLQAAANGGAVQRDFGEDENDAPIAGYESFGYEVDR